MSDHDQVNAAAAFTDECVAAARRLGVRGYIVAATAINPAALTQVFTSLRIGSPKHGLAKIASSDAAVLAAAIVRSLSEHPEVMQSMRAILAADGTGDGIGDGVASA